jgi:3-oxoacyl-[acyl-carrier protein] reductase
VADEGSQASTPDGAGDGVLDGAPDGALDGKVAIVTGVGRGIGRAEALGLAAAGARVVANDFGPGAGPVVEEIRAAGGQAVAHDGDVADFDTGRALVELATSTYGDLDILVNNAGFTRDKMIFSMSEQDWDDVVRVHLKGHFVTTRWATAYWRDRAKSGGPRDAAIVNTASEAFLIGSIGQPNYAAAKAGITALTCSTAQGCARYGVRANAICPRARTQMTEPQFGPPPADGPDPLAPSTITPFVTFLASPAAARISGQVFIVYGTKIGLVASPHVERRFDAAGGSWAPGELAGGVGSYFDAQEKPTAFASLDILAGMA